MNLFRKTRLRTQLIVSFVLLTGLMLFAIGFYLDWQLKRTVEKGIGERLSDVAELAAFEAARTQAFNLLPGDEQTRTSRNLRQSFRKFIVHGGVSRLLIVDSTRQVYFDSEGALNIGDEHVRMRFDSEEIRRALESGTAQTSVLFRDEEDAVFKAAYAPILGDRDVVGLVYVEGDANALAVVDETRNLLLTIGFAALLAAFLFAALLSRQMTRPLEKLQKAATAIKLGKYEAVVEGSGNFEVAELSQNIEEMRLAIARRHERQQMMLAGIAHEIRNPLGGIELFASLLQKQANEEARPQAEKILKEVQYLKKIVVDFLAYARPLEPKPRKVNLRALIEEVKGLVPAENFENAWKIEVDGKTKVLFDPDHLRSILLNLFGNAVEALSDHQAPVIHISVEQRKQKILLSVADNGPGISDDAKARIFEPFYTTRSQGAGLGLALVKLLVEENNGEIALVERKCGACFGLTLPLA